MDEQRRTTALAGALAERILVLDGAMGTQLQQRELGPEDFGGERHEGCNEHLVITRPDIVRAIHEEYLAAGADIIETDTFGGTRIVLGEYGLAERVSEINRTAAVLARQAAGRFSTPDRPRFVAGSMGPGTKTISVTGGITFAEIEAAYREQALALIAGGVDLLFLETQQDILNVKAALIGIDRAMAESGRRVPVVLSVSIESNGTMLAGHSIEAAYVSVEQRELFAIGMNCATGPEFMADHLRTLAAISRFPVVCFPNAGLPDAEGRYPESPETLAAKLERFVAQGWVNILGGCCGTGPGHIREIAAMVAGRRPRRAQASRRSAVAGIEVVPLDEERRPILVGERTNVIGSRRFKSLIAAGALDEAAEVARRQVRAGAQILDVCLADPDRDERQDMPAFLDVITRRVKVPLMIDSTDPVVIEDALQRCPGKPIVNSINLEEGEARFARVAPLVRRYGAAVVVGCIDEDKEQGMALSRERKFDIAERSYRLLTERYGVAPEDIIFDTLVFPVGTGDDRYRAAGAETIAAVELVKRRFPRSKTLLGISNVSFGLPTAGREVLNSVFLYHCVKAGLDLAIVNTEKLERYPSIPAEERKLAEDLLFARGEDPLGAFTAHFRTRPPRASVATRAAMPLEERLARYVIEGSRDGLIEDLERARATLSPLEIINGPLMAGMAEVGRLFNSNQLIVAEVLQSAEVMKAAVAYLEPFMERAETATRGCVLLATVKGDVHDIGKNLVEIILANNGFRVIDLGIKVPPEEIVRACGEHRPDIVGLSGLLVKSAQQMVATAQDMREAGISCPLLVGGAALSATFTATRIAPAYGGPVCYAKDAMQGLALANRLVDPERRQELLASLRSEQAERRTSARQAPRPVPTAAAARPVDHSAPPPQPPDLDLHVIDGYDLDEIFAYVNPSMLYGKHLGLRGNLDDLLAARDERARELVERVAAVRREATRRGLLRGRAVYRFYLAAGEGDEIVLFDRRGGNPVARLRFPRQSEGERLCLADFVAPRSAGIEDSVALFALTCGHGIRELSAEWKAEGHYLDAHILQALALECAEGFAELLHRRLRELWGFPDPPEMTMRERFKARYRGVRVSFGYPACPRLEDQAVLFQLLQVEERIGVRLTEGFMMDPEASVSALVFHHPEARYFAIPEKDLASLEKELAAKI